MITDNFKEWGCSFSGCDGGNLNAKIWISGIEWGGGDEGYYQKLPNEISKGTYDISGKYDWKDSLSYPYGRSLAKLFAAIHGHKVSGYRSYAESLSGDEIFKLNLYPIAFKNTGNDLWRQHELDKITGFEEKELFKAWCFINRFPFFSEQVQKIKPEIIIGTGVNYLVDFFACFASGHKLKDFIRVEKIGERKLFWARISEKTHLFVIPFFSGSYGLNSDNLLQEFGDNIKEISRYEP